MRVLFLVIALCVVLYGCATSAKMESANYAGEYPTQSDSKISQNAPKKMAKDNMVASNEESDVLAGFDDAAGDVDAPEVPVDNSPDKSETKRTAPEEKATTLYLSADDSNSQASPIVVRNRIMQGRYVDPEMVRTYEFLNYYTFEYPPAETNSLKIYPEMSETQKPGEYSLQIAVRSEERLRRAVLPLNFTFVVDISGSMAGEPQKLVKMFLRRFIDTMQKGDHLSVIVCNRYAKTVVEFFEYDAAKIEDIWRKIDTAIVPDDITDLHQGIAQAYKIATKNYEPEFLNRVVLLSDGATNAGELSINAIKQHSEDSEKQGIYLVGVGFGEGFNDSLMNAFTDAGKGAYFFVTSEKDVTKALGPDFVANFDLAVKDVRLKMVMPPSWSMVEFHGEQVSTVASEVIPQHLSPNDQMIYHQILGTSRSLEAVLSQDFVFEAEFTEVISNQRKTVDRKISVQEMLQMPLGQIIKGDAIAGYAEMLKKIQWPLDENRTENLKAFNEAFSLVEKVHEVSQDEELGDIKNIMIRYKSILENGEQLERSLDKNSNNVAHTLGINDSNVVNVKVSGANPDICIHSRSKLNSSTQLQPREGYKFLLISTGPVGNNQTKGRGKISSSHFDDPAPDFMGLRQAREKDNVRIHDLHQVTLTLKAPENAKSFSFDFNFFSAEYPEYVKKNFNDTFYAIIQAPSTNNGARTNIAFDSNHNSIEVDNNYFQNPFHPVSNRGTGFDNGGSTSWLRTSWPIRGGETFTITFSVHDEGDEIYDSLVVLDNFLWHEYECVGNTDPLN